MAAGIHRQRTAHRAGNAGEKLRLGQSRIGRKARQLGRGDSSLGIQAAVGLAAQYIQRAMGEDRGALEAAVTHQQIAAKAEQQQRFVMTKLLQTGG